ncbi:MmcQ/YjbR family DNA-binding protein [Weissella diestrammenae]|uniref:MmcQ/YjbR family DNA-binding protein n=1 Tax=Weissella diestrammenae TaxID=1162633 RepID=A0A7G9T3J6_9LACO|nr:MmcQ/YjbR family DNA-binding protein [Weissella diestrammenae]MCM0582642.1 MmcQ/YjbR family DNA-binding protein [Weissella diestrammenae]QNN74671.1 MmcQ/YjbR family DNA-binding protein [Weissella diestrammenae]
MSEVDHVIQRFLSANGGYLAYPFNQPGRQQTVLWHVLKHRSNQKMYAAIFEKDQHILINIKLTPAHVDEMVQQRGIERGFHMNKRHWVTIDLMVASLSEAELDHMVAESAQLTR